MGPDPTYIDAIGVPRGVPNEYKLVDQIAAGFEGLPIISAILPITPHKNVDRINYHHYKILRLTNYTLALGKALAEQLHATSAIAYQNRLALDMVLAERGGVCAFFKGQCCLFIPNNTAADGSVTRTLQGLQMFADTMHEQSGVNNIIEEWFNSTFGSWKNIVLSIFTSLLICISVFVLCGCCCIPCIRLLLLRVFDRMFEKIEIHVAEECEALLANLNLDYTQEENSV
ncbi:hypothetical protein NL108_017333 [Boleophthalmus pectinirostris]|nr:hypothetical protein NL108_017333 [Boleophthalmus pectinirostris]